MRKRRDRVEQLELKIRLLANDVVKISIRRKQLASKGAKYISAKEVSEEKRSDLKANTRDYDQLYSELGPSWLKEVERTG